MQKVKFGREGVVMLFVAFLLSSCWFGSSDDGYDTVKGSLSIRSVKPGTGNLSSSLLPSSTLLLETIPTAPPLAPALTPPAGIQVREQAGPADSLVLTLRGVSFIMKGGDEVKALDPDTQSPLTITLTGDGAAAQTLQLDVPVGTIEKVKLFFDPFAKIKGKIENKNYTDGTNSYENLSVQTKAQYYFDAQKGKMMDSNGTLDDRSDDTDVSSNPPSYTTYQYTPPTQGANPEEALLCLTNDESYFYVETPLGKPISAGSTPAITLAADLSRMLRFSIGGSELWPDNPTIQGWSMFVANHYINYLFAAFVETSGTIQGYEYVYAPSETELDQPWAKTGWMTLVFGSDGSLAYGVLVPDGQAGSPEGYVENYADTESSISFDVRKDAQTTVNISGFTRKSTIDEVVTADLTAPASDPNNPSSLTNGKIRFTLKMQYTGN